MIKVLFFGSKPYVEQSFNDYVASIDTQFLFSFQKDNINSYNAHLIKGFDVACIFVNDKVDASIVEILKSNGCKLIALRCAGYNNVDLVALKAADIPVVRVPAYSPYAVAEYAFTLLLTLNRKTHKAYSRVRELNFNIDGLLGFDLNGKTIGVIGTGKIGQIFIKIASGFGMKIIAYDPYPKAELEQDLGFTYVSLEDLYKHSDIIALHCPLNNDNYHMINSASVALMKPAVVIINTSRGGLINSKDMIVALKNKQIAGLAIDVYEEEEHYFFEDLSNKSSIDDDVLSRLLTFNNVLVSSHQAFFTKEAVESIAKTTISNISTYFLENKLNNQVQ